LGLATVTELRERLDVQQQSTASDEFLQLYLDSATKTAERYCKRKFEAEPDLTDDPQVAVTKTISTLSRDVLRIPDVRTVNSVVLAGVTLSPVDVYGFGGFALSGESPGEPYTWITLRERQRGHTSHQDLAITGFWGWNPAPADIKDAVLTLASRKYRERDAGYGDTVQLPEGGVIAYFSQLPSSVAMTLDSYRIPTFAIA
jgi:hypothetical protein